MKRVLIIVAALVVLALALWRWNGDTFFVSQTRPDGATVARVVTTTFEKRSKLIVADNRGTVKATARDPGFIALLASDQTISAPFTVEYTVDLNAIKPADLRWSAKRRTVFVTLPDVVVERPAIDISAMTTSRRGLYITDRASAALIKAASGAAQQAAFAKASEPGYVLAAQAQARTKVAELLRAPMVAAGMKDIAISVRFASDPQGSTERWDESRPLSDFYAR